MSNYNIYYLFIYLNKNSNYLIYKHKKNFFYFQKLKKKKKNLK